MHVTGVTKASLEASRAPVRLDRMSHGRSRAVAWRRVLTKQVCDRNLAHVRRRHLQALFDARGKSVPSLAHAENGRGRCRLSNVCAVLNSQSVSKAMHPPPEAASPCPGTATCRLDEKTSGKIFQTSGGWGNRQWLIAVRERVLRKKTFARRQTAWRRCCESQELQLRSSLPFCRQLFAALALSSPVCWMRTSLVCCP